MRFKQNFSRSAALISARQFAVAVFKCHICSSLYLQQNLRAGQFTAGDMLRALMSTPAQFRCSESQYVTGIETMAYASSFRIQPALTIDRATAANGIAILREVFDEMNGRGSWRHL